MPRSNGRPSNRKAKSRRVKLAEYPFTYVTTYYLAAKDKNWRPVVVALNVMVGRERPDIFSAISDAGSRDQFLWNFMTNHYCGNWSVAQREYYRETNGVPRLQMALARRDRTAA